MEFVTLVQMKTLMRIRCDSASYESQLSKLAESFYYVNHGSSIIMSKVRQIISVMKTETVVFPEKWYVFQK